MSEYWTRRRALTTTKDADDDWKPPPRQRPPHEWRRLFQSACVRACTTPSLHRKHKKTPPATTRDKKSDGSIAKRERERERNTKKERSPAAGDDPHWPTLLCGWCVDPTHKFTRQNSTRVVVLSSFESAQRAASVNVLLSFVFLLFDGRVNHQTTTTGVPSSPGGGVGGEQRRDKSLRLTIMSSFFSSQEKKRKTF